MASQMEIQAATLALLQAERGRSCVLSGDFADAIKELTPINRAYVYRTIADAVKADWQEATAALEKLKEEAE